MPRRSCTWQHLPMHDANVVERCSRALKCLPGTASAATLLFVCRDLWLECARRAFAGLDANSDGRLSVETLIATLRDKLPATEVDYAVEDALVEAGYAGGCGWGEQWEAEAGKVGASCWQAMSSCRGARGSRGWMI